MMKPADTRILVVDAEDGTRKHLSESLTRMGYVVEAVDSAAAAINCLSRQPFAVVIYDDNLTVDEGVDILSEAPRLRPEVAVIVMSASPSVSSVIGSLRRGVYDYVIKPYELTELATIVPRAVEYHRSQTRPRADTEDRAQAEVASGQSVEPADFRA